MRVAIFTNTYRPHIGGVARSVGGLVDGLRGQGNEVLVIAPEFPKATTSTKDVIRIPALQNFGGSDFSIPSPVSGSLLKQLNDFSPDIVHSHHPFLLGGTALRIAAARQVPIVYTYHTRYDLYSHYVVNNSDLAIRLVRNLSFGYCDLCDAVIAPSRSIAGFIKQNDVKSPVTVIPTGVNTVQLGNTNASDIRTELNIPDDAFIIGHVGRLAQEKNLVYLSEAICLFLSANVTAHAVIAGDGMVADKMRDSFAQAKVEDRVHMIGVASGKHLAQAYAAMDLFVFSSVSETQGLVIIEAMAAGAPVVALDAPGVRDAVIDGENGRLLPAGTTVKQFTKVMTSMASLSTGQYGELSKNALSTAQQFSQSTTVEKTVNLYSSLIGDNPAREPIELSAWKTTRRSLAEEWNIIGNVASAITDAVLLPATLDDE